MYTCKRCKKEFDRKSNYEYHVNKKYKCKFQTGSKTSKKIMYPCPKCNKEFTRKYSLDRHLVICKVKVVNKIKGHKNLNNIGDFNNMASKSTNCNNININLFVFSKDGIENISRKDLCSILRSDKNIFESIISNVNLNPDKPQHHNIFYGDTKSSYGEVYEDKKWIKRKIDEILNTLLDAKIEDLNEILNDMGDFLNKKTRDKIKDAIKNIDCKKVGSRKKLITYLKPILYNHKEMIIKTRKLSKKQEDEIFRLEQEKAEREEEELNRISMGKKSIKKSKKKNESYSDSE